MAKKAYDIFINGYIGDMFDFFGDGNSFSLRTLNDKLAAMPAGTTEINVHINSGGGLVSEGFAIYDKLVSLPQTVNTIVEGMCGSIATVIAQAGKKGKRKMFQNSEYFIHNPLWIPSGPDAHNADDLEKLTNELRANEEKLVAFYLKNINADEQKLRDKMGAESTLSATEAQAMGFIDEIISTDVVAMVKYRIAAAVSIPVTKQQSIIMDIKSEFAEFKKGFLADITALIKGKTVAVKVETSEGVTVFYDGELTIGTKVYTDEAMTQPAPDGVHTVGDKKFTIANGEVVSEEAASVAKTDLEIANEKNAELTAQLEAAQSEITALKQSETQLIASVKKIESDFNAFVAKIETGTGFKVDAQPVDKNKPNVQANKTWQELAAERRKTSAN